MRTVPKPRLSGESSTCKPWCSLHDTDGGVCLGAAASLDFRSPDRGPGLVAWAEAALGYSPEEGTDMSVTFPGAGTAYITVDDAEKLANMLRDLVTQARATTAPRASTEGGAK